MKLKILLFSIILFVAKSLWSQDDYNQIECQGVIPSEFIDLTSDKIDLANENYKGKKKMEVSKRQYNRYNSESTFYIDYLLKSGLIVFGTPMNDYLDRVGQYVLKSFPGISNEVRFYIVKSPTVNAFTNEQGIVFINIGLIAQLENEAQLAFIISHELIHYKYNHSFKAYKEQVRAESNWDDYRNITNSSKKNRLLKYSRSNETFADSLGFLEGYFFTKYNYDEVLKVFDVLLYSDLPFDEIEFDTAYFNDENYSLSPSCILKDVSLISTPDDYDDHNMTHPNIKKRRSSMINIITEYDNPNTAKYIISESEFLKLQKDARFEMTNLYLTNLQYAKAFYNTYLLLRKYPDSDYLNKSLAYCVYAMALKKKLGSINKHMVSYNKVEGHSQRVNYLFKKIKTKELASIGVKLLWNYHIAHPQDSFILSVLNKSIDFLIEENNIKFSNIYPPRIINLNTDSSKRDTTINFKKLSKEEYQELSKYDKIRYDKKYQKYYGAKKGQSKTIATKNYLSVLSTESANEEFAKLYKNRQQNIDKEIPLVSVDQFMLVNPLFYKIKNDVLIVQGAEQHEIDFSNSMNKAAARRNIDISVLDILKISENEVDKFNDLALLNTWLDEYDGLNEDDDFRYTIPWSSNYISRVRKKYNLRYIANTGLLEIDNTRGFNRRFGFLLKSIMFWQASPYFVTEIFNNEHQLYQYFYCIDLETNTTILFDENNFEAKPSSDYMDAMNYNIMYQLKEKK